MSRGVLTSPRARFFAACAVGGVLAILVFAWVVFVGSADLTRPEPLGNFYEVQARSLLHGHWDVPPRSLSFERFNIDGRFYMYQGPWPSILRMPIVAFTDELDGQLSRLSMLLAFVLLLAFVARIAWQARSMLRGVGMPTRRAQVAAGAFVFVVGCGSSALFLGSRSWVYHEAILWGAAWSVVAASFVIGYLMTGRLRDLVLTSAATTLAVLSRGSVGAGVVVVIGVIVLLQLVVRASKRLAARREPKDTTAKESLADRLVRWSGIPRGIVERPVLPSAIALVVPVALYAYVNYAKFGSLFSLPIAKQDLLRDLPARRAALEASATLFSPKFAPTNLLQYFRPDAIGFDSLFPWVTFSRPLTNVGDIPFDNIEPSASITATSVLLVVLAVLGVVAAIRAPRTAESQASIALFRVPIFAFGAVTGGAILLGVHFQRYEGDFLPVLVLASAAGLFFLPSLLARRTTVQRRCIAAVLVVLAAWSCWATFALTVRYQRTISAFGLVEERQDFVDFQLDVADALGTGGPADVRFGDELPSANAGELAGREAPLGQLFVVGDCEGLYISSRKGWELIEQKAVGEQRWQVAFSDPEPGRREPLWSNDDGDVVWARWVDRDYVVFEFEDGTSGMLRGGTEELRVRPGEVYELAAKTDPRAHYVEVKVGDRLLLSDFPPELRSVAGARLGRQDDPARGATRLAGTIRDESLTPLCDRIAAA